ncbi:uncharacterized protein BCR38DRAFT_448607 [Pseudomassariella vexata]|uniref:Uncharacterized protein n=1 Tax=Pseudomassariella vexata TaxID=1141098 RepID=A0A1Y2DGF2_9PEZI|nr:uncharacterized protein BCR38DRAFT_448607 [Pseudomassariella vexata]ORY57765.1 hypothetical protein BCR38DRAFT_448607 [Pseudomassariella vexata]
MNGYDDLEMPDPNHETFATGWPYPAQPLSSLTWSHLLQHHLLDAIGISSTFLFITLAVAAGMVHGSPTGSHLGWLVEESSKLAPSIFPILFATVLGKALRSIGRFRAELGVDLGTLQALMGVRTLSQAFSNLAEVRSFTMTSLSLLVLWCLSPLGGQASLRVLGRTNETATEEVGVRYLDTGPLAHLYTQMWTSRLSGSRESGMDAMLRTGYVGALMQSLEAKLETEDIWGNVKIPRLECLSEVVFGEDGSGRDATKVHEVECYSSLIGLPVVGLSGRDTADFILETSYVSLACNEAKNVSKDELWTSRTYENQPDPDGWFGGLNMTYMFPDSNLSAVDPYHDYEDRWASRVSGFLGLNRSSSRPQIPQALSINLAWLEGTFKKEITESDGSETHFDTQIFLENRSYNETNCTATRQFVEAKIHCHQGVCAALGVRPLAFENLSPNYTAFDYWASIILDIITTDTQRYTQDWSAAPSSITEYFLSDSSALPLPERNTGNSEAQIVKLSGVPHDVFSRRLSMLLNTYIQLWMSGSSFIRNLPMDDLSEYGTEHAPSDGLRMYDISADEIGYYNNYYPDDLYSLAQQGQTPFIGASTNVTVTRYTEVYQAQPVWVALLMITSMMLVFSGVLGIVCAILTTTPDRFDPVIGQTYDNPAISVLSGGNTLNYKERARILRKVVVRTGDVSGGADVGRVGLGTIGNVQPLRRRKLYR